MSGGSSEQRAGKRNLGQDIENDGELTSALFRSFVQALKSSRGLSTSGVAYEVQSVTPEFRARVERIQQRLQRVASGLVRAVRPRSATDIHSALAQTDTEERFASVVEVVDDILEEADKALDEARGIRRGTDAVMLDAENAFAMREKNRQLNILRPQMHFDDEIDNRNSPFVPRLRSKPNAITPLEFPLQPESSSRSLELPGNFSDRITAGSSLQKVAFVEKGYYANPYESEIIHFSYTDDQLSAKTPQVFRSLAETPFTFVDSVEGLQQVVAALEGHKEIAIDLENHDRRSYQGFLCLMQISTRKEDFVIDTLSLRSELHVLNRFFTDPEVVKVLHGAVSDIVWLQRDLGLYIVNMFDTMYASQALQFQANSLAYLLKTFCNVDADKKYQRADWRERPLSEEMMKYAREDTHYLLYVYDRLKNQLLESSESKDDSLVREVLDRSRILCLQRYDKTFDCEAAATKRLKREKDLGGKDVEIFKALFRWRDAVARRHDESPVHVMPPWVLVNLARRKPTRPQDPACLKCRNFPFLRQYLDDVLRIIRDPSSAPANEPTVTPVEDGGPADTNATRTPPSSTTAAPRTAVVSSVRRERVVPAGIAAAQQLTSALQLPIGRIVEGKETKIQFSPRDASARSVADFLPGEDADAAVASAHRRTVQSVLSDVQAAFVDVVYGRKWATGSVEDVPDVAVDDVAMEPAAPSTATTAAPNAASERVATTVVHGVHVPQPLRPAYGASLSDGALRSKRRQAETLPEFDFASAEAALAADARARMSEVQRNSAAFDPFREYHSQKAKSAKSSSKRFRKSQKTIRVSRK